MSDTADRPVKYHLQNPEDAGKLLAQDFHNVSDRDAKQAMRRQSALSEMFVKALTERVEATGDRYMKVSWKEYLVIRQDPDFEPLSKYLRNLMFYGDGRPRPKPVRPLVVNEVGMFLTGTFAGRIVFLKDAGPDDVGEGKYYSGFDIGKDKDETVITTVKDGKVIKQSTIPAGTEMDAAATKELVSKLDVDGAIVFAPPGSDMERMATEAGGEPVDDQYARGLSSDGIPIAVCPQPMPEVVEEDDPFPSGGDH
jgi:hypothetical protein